MSERDMLIDGEAPGARRLRLYLVRHGEQAEAADAYDDPGLTPRGWRQAHALAARLRPTTFHAIYISPLRRTLETAQPLLEAREAVPARVTADLVEVLRDHALVTVARAAPTIRGTLEQERDAMLRFINRIRHTHEPGDNILIVAHGNLIRALIPMFAGRDPAAAVLMEVHHTALSLLDLWPNSSRAVLILGNDTRHLEAGTPDR